MEQRESLGLFDRNGTEIFTGDFIECGDLLTTVWFQQRGERFGVDLEGREKDELIASRSVVVGNKFEKPDLLTNNPTE